MCVSIKLRRFLQEDLIFIFLGNARDNDASVKADRGKYPRVGSTPLDTVDAFFVLLEGL